MLGILIHSSVGWSFDHIFCCLLCTFIWHKQWNTHTHTYMGEAICTTPHCDSLSHVNTSALTFTGDFNSPHPHQTQVIRTRRCTCIHAHTQISFCFSIQQIWVTRDWLTSPPPWRKLRNRGMQTWTADNIGSVFTTTLLSLQPSYGKDPWKPWKM